MVELRARVTPELWATLEALFAKLAAPGMCNPADPEPCVSGTPTQEQIDNDQRSLAQRQHDALLAACRIALMSGELGQHNGLPVSIVIRTTLQDLETRAGIATTAGGTTLPIGDVLRLAAHADHHLAVFDRATGSALAHFRGRRTAGAAQDSCSSPATAAAPNPDAPSGRTGARRITPRATGPRAATPTSTRWGWPAARTTGRSTPPTRPPGPPG